MKNSLRNKIEITENIFQHLKQELPEDIYSKLQYLIGQSFDTFEDFNKILVSLLTTNFEIHKETIYNFIDLIEDDDDTLEEDMYNIDDEGKGSIYPYDPSKADIDIREDPQTVYELVVRKWDRQLIEMPDFQRKFVWKPEQQSLFIESVLLNFPLPPLYINKNVKGKYIVVDGRQRITTLRNFIENKFRLNGLRAFPQLNGKNFNDLKKINTDYQIKIEDRKLLVYLIQPSAPLEMVYDIFNRINTGGTQLERQEIRNCIYLGIATDFIQKLAASKEFKRAIDFGISDNRAKDQEAVLRYLSFKILDYNTDYKGSMNDFVEKAMKFLNAESSPEILNSLEVDFKKAMVLTFNTFSRNNFRIPTENTRGRINIAVLETVAGFFASKSEGFISKNKEILVNNFKALINNKEYLDAVRFSTGDKRRVFTRFELTNSILSTDIKI